MNLECFKLENGLKIYLVNDNRKHTTYINLIVKFGGMDNKVMIENQKCKIKNGSAHFLEHLVLEQTEYGDLMKIFGESGAISNGFTSIDRTQFYVDSVKDAEKHLELLIKGIHSPLINNNTIKKIKNPILEEKRRSLDNKYTNLYNNSLGSLINDKKFKSILGDLNDIESIEVSDMALAFNTFYRPNNEIIVIGGKFDKKKILEIIKNAYNGLKFDDKQVAKIKNKLQDKVSKKKIIVKDDINMERCVLSFKLNLLNLSSFDKILLDIYIFFFLKMNFGIMSNLNTKLVNDNIIISNIGYSSNILNGYNIIRIEANSKDSDKFYKTILDYILNKRFIFDKDLFELYKKNYIIDLIVRNDDIYKTVDPLIENILSFDYENLDSINDIENITFDDFKNKIEDINFTTYNVSILKKK